jgi:hypothetical protein
VCASAAGEVPAHFGGTAHATRGPAPDRVEPANPRERPPMGRAAHRRGTTVGTLSPRSRGAWMDGRGRTLSSPTRERHAARLPPAPAYSHQWDDAARPPQHPLLSRPAHATGVAARGLPAHRRICLLSTRPETTLRVVLHSRQSRGGNPDLARVAASSPDSDAARRHRTGHRGCTRHTGCPRSVATGQLRRSEGGFPLLTKERVRAG